MSDSSYFSFVHQKSGISFSKGFKLVFYEAYIVGGITITSLVITLLHSVFSAANDFWDDKQRFKCCMLLVACRNSYKSRYQGVC